MIKYLILILLTGFAIWAQDKPCSSVEACQLDFWIGEWSAQWKSQEGEISRGTNIIKKILGGCVIEENFSTMDNSFVGNSFSVYNPNKKLWQQTWVDNSGAYLDFTGEYKDEKMIFSRNALNKQGIQILQRMVFYDITANEFNWNWESSDDNGTTWKLLWKIHYVRKN